MANIKKKSLILYLLIPKLKILQGLALSYVEVSKTVLLVTTINVIKKLDGYFLKLVACLDLAPFHLIS